MTWPGHSDPPPPVGARRRGRPWLIALVAAWIVVVAGVGVWSVGHERASVPEQRDIAQAVPELQKAAGVVFAAAGGPGRAVVLGELALAKGCRVTPVRAGVTATRDVTVHVRAGAAGPALDAIADGLPASYRADIATSRGGTELSLHADAGNFIGIDADIKAEALALTLRLSTGCRPPGPEDADRADPVAGAAPALVNTVLGALGAPPASFTSPGAGGPAGDDVTEAVRAVACPGRGVAGTFVVDGVATPADLAQRLRGISSGAEVVRDDDAVRAFRTGNESVVVVPDGQRLRISVSTAC